MKRIGYFFIFVLLFPGCKDVFQTKQKKPALKHIVLLWLNEPGETTHRKQLIGVADVLKQIPGVIEISVGEPLASEREVVDDSFDIAYIFTFKDAKSMNEYLFHPEHKKAVEAMIRPIVAKMLVYDYLESLP